MPDLIESGAWGAATHVGARRTLNEDAYLAQAPIFVVADGMGGHEQGEVASGIAIAEFASLTQYSSLVAEQVDSCFGRAQARLRAVLAQGTGGTTVCGVAVVFVDDSPYWLVFNLGDSRAYLLTGDGELSQVSVDHSVVQEMVDSGNLTAHEATTHADRHVITRALETVTEPAPDYWLLPISTGDQILLCSDGLTDELPNSEIARIWSGAPSAQLAADHLVHSAYTAGGRDNITVVVVTSEVVEGIGRTATQATHQLSPTQQNQVQRSQTDAD